MKQTTLASTVITKTVAASIISAKTSAAPTITTAAPTTHIGVNSQLIGTAPDSSGKIAYQYEALIGNGVNMFGSVAAAEQNCIQSATANGHMQYARVTGLPSNQFAIVAW